MKSIKRKHCNIMGIPYLILEVNLCNKVLVVAHGNVHISKKNTAVVQCNPGYILKGSRNYVCSNNNLWIGSSVCRKYKMFSIIVNCICTTIIAYIQQ